MSLHRFSLVGVCSLVALATSFACGGGDSEQSAAPAAKGGTSGSAGRGGMDGGGISGSGGTGGSSGRGGTGGSGGTIGTAGSGGVGGTPDAGKDGPDVECQRDSECVVPATTPPSCAEAKCQANACVFFAKDSDGDNQRAANCEATGNAVSIETGPDCDDKDAEVNSRHEETCDGKDNDCNQQIDDGVPVSTIPCTTELKGVCEGRGFYECDGGKYTKCNAVPAATPGPAEARECDSVDRNCNGKIDNAQCKCRPGDQFTCSRVCGGSYTVTCSSNGEFPACDPGPGRGTHCPDADADGYPGSCNDYCPSDVPSGWKPVATFGGRAADCADNDPRRSPGNPEVCDGIDNNCNNDLGDEPNKSCPGCGPVACAATCPAQCPAGFSPQPDGTCLSDTEDYSYNENRQVCAPFPCAGLRTDETIGGACNAGQVRSSVDIRGTAGTGHCEGYFAGADPTDCSVRVHFGAAWCDCFTCQIHVRSRRVIPQCQ